MDVLAKTPVTNYQSTLRKIQEERRSKNSDFNSYVDMNITQAFVQIISHIRALF